MQVLELVTKLDPTTSALSMSRFDWLWLHYLILLNRLSVTSLKKKKVDSWRGRRVFELKTIEINGVPFM